MPFEFEPQNIKDVSEVLKEIRAVYPSIKIYLWTGYTGNDLLRSDRLFGKGKYTEPES